jgi:hypothetical protein
MASVPSAVNNTKDESFVMIQCNYNNVIDKAAVSKVNPKLLKNMEMGRLSEKAKAVISSLEKSGKKIFFAHESHTNGDCDEDGPTEIFYTLFLIVEEDDEETCSFAPIPLKFCREVFYKQGDSNASVDYQSEELYDEDKHLFDAILHDMHSNDYDYTEEEIAWNSKDHVYNTQPSDLSKQGKKTLKKFKAGLAETDEVIFIGEDETYGECDKDGPLEYFFTLYIFVKKEDGTVVHHKFYREFHWYHDKEMDAVPYEDDVMRDKDYQEKQFHF